MVRVELPGWVPDPASLVRKAEKAGAGEAEIYIVYGRYKTVKAKNNTLELAQQDSRVALGVRVAVSKKIAASGGAIASAADAERIIERAVRLARASAEDPAWPGFNPRIGVSFTPQLYDPRIAGLTMDELTGLIRRAIDRVTQPGPVRVDLAEGYVSASEATRVYANSYGGPVQDESTFAGLGLELTAKGPEGEGTYYDWYGRARYEPEKIEDMIERSYKRAVDTVRARPWTTMKTTLILERDEAAGIVGLMVAPAVSAEQVQKGRSPLAGRLGEQVFNGRLTIIDDPSLDWESGSAGFDDEGHPTRVNRIVSKGVLETYLYDHYTAAREGRESTGNAARGSPWTKTSPAPHNMIVMDEGAVEDFDKFISGFDEAVLAVSTIGSWMSNPVSGTINATITLGYLVRHGSVEAVVKGLTWGDDVFRALGGAYAGMGGPRECRSGVCIGSVAVLDAALAGK